MLTFDTDQFDRAVERYDDQLTDGAVHAINEACDVAMKVAEDKAPEATAANIERDLRKDNLLAKLASKRLGTGHTKQQRIELMNRIRRQRLRAAGALKRSFKRVKTATRSATEAGFRNTAKYSGRVARVAVVTGLEAGKRHILNCVIK